MNAFFKLGIVLGLGLVSLLLVPSARHDLRQVAAQLGLAPATTQTPVAADEAPLEGDGLPPPPSVAETPREQEDREYYEELVRRDPRSAAARLGLASHYHRRGRTDDARAQLARAKRLDPTNPSLAATEAELSRPSLEQSLAEASAALEDLLRDEGPEPIDPTVRSEYEEYHRRRREKGEPSAEDRLTYLQDLVNWREFGAAERELAELRKIDPKNPFLKSAQENIDEGYRTGHSQWYIQKAWTMEPDPLLPTFSPEEMAKYDAEQETVGSSRVDLQACKLEYSIVSPK